LEESSAFPARDGRLYGPSPSINNRRIGGVSRNTDVLGSIRSLHARRGCLVIAGLFLPLSFPPPFTLRKRGVAPVTCPEDCWV
jgi:hypothetical protein